MSRVGSAVLCFDGEPMRITFTSSARKDIVSRGKSDKEEQRHIASAIAPSEELAHGYAVSDPVLQQIGNTPLVRHPAANVWCKMERDSPTLSHKDRLALGMLLELRSRGELVDGQPVVEASSGNMAGGVALACNRLGHPCTIVSPETASPIKMGFVRALGAELIQVPPAAPDAPAHYQNRAEAIAQETDALYVNQYERALNREVHYNWTGPELWEQIADRSISAIVAAVGSGGTLSGIGQYVNARDASIRIVGVDAEASNISKDFYGEDRGEYDTVIEGLGQHRTTAAINFDVINEIRSVPDDVAIERAIHEAAEHGLLLGLSSGAVMEVARDIADERTAVVAIVHDGAEQYFHQIDAW